MFLVWFVCRYSMHCFCIDPCVLGLVGFKLSQIQTFSLALAIPKYLVENGTRIDALFLWEDYDLILFAVSGRRRIEIEWSVYLENVSEVFCSHKALSCIQFPHALF